ncbi:MAG: T9SS type A sorting domain-containing protein [bacterium]
MKKPILILCVLLLLLFPALALAQDVAGLEYFIDTGSGVGAGTWVSVSTAGEIDQSFNVDVSGVSTGFHILYVRVVDSNGAWSLPFARPFLKETLSVEPVADIDAAEYFFDVDPGVGNATPVALDPGSVVTLEFAVDVGVLSEGLHVFHVRTRDGNGAWSPVLLKPVYVERLSVESPVNIVQAEFFIDTDPSVGNGTEIGVTADTDVALEFNVDLSGLSQGLHLLHVRASDAAGRWSVVTLKPFLVEALSLDSPENIVRMEYFFDTDPGFGGGAGIDLFEGSSAQLDFVADLGELSDGLHVLHVRSMDERGGWSVEAMKPFLLETRMASEEPGEIVCLEWRFQTNGFATDTVCYTDFTPGSDLDLQFEADLSALNPFTSYDYYLHAIDDRGAQSLHYVHSFTMQPSPESFALLSPVNNDTVWSSDTTLVWQSTIDPDSADSVVCFDVWLDTLSEFNTAVLIADSIADTSLAVDNLLDDHVYWWAVRATDSNTPGSWSRNKGQFSIYVPEPPQPFSLTAPDSGGEIPDAAEFPLVFHWNTPYDPDPGDTVFCRLEISSDGEFSDPAIFTAGAANSFAVSELEQGFYWWRIYAHDRFGFEVYSLQTWTLDVTLSLNDDLLSSLPERYEISALYPNPFNPVLTVVIGLPEPAFLKVDVFNMLGQHVAQLVNEPRQAGYHRFQLNSNRLASGVYLVRATVPGKMNEVMRVVLLR